MGLISLDKVHEGMMIESDVIDPCGRILLRGGQQLLKHHIDVFHSCRIEEIDIAGIDPKDFVEDTGIDPEILSMAVSELEPIFVLVNLKWDVMMEIHRYAVQSHARKKIISKKNYDLT